MGRLNSNILFVKERASSIIEVTVALVIISLTFSIFIMIYVNLLAGNFYVQKLKYEGQLTQRYAHIIKTRNFVDDVSEQNHVKIFQTVSAYRGNDKLKIIHLRAISENGKVLAELRSLHYEDQ